MNIEKVKITDEIEEFIEKEQEKYESKNDIECNYTPFCFVAKLNNEIVGSISGATFFKEVYIDELVVKEEYRNQNIGTKLVKYVEDYYKDLEFNNMNTITNEFQAPKFYEKCGFELEFVRKNKDNPKLNKYFYIKYF